MAIDVHAFAYRAPRFAAELPLEFAVLGGTVAGRSRNLSELGLLASFAEPLLPGAAGRLRLQIESCTVEVAAQVTYAELGKAGLRFCFANEAERTFIQTLVKVISRKARQAEPRRKALLA